MDGDGATTQNVSDVLEEGTGFLSCSVCQICGEFIYDRFVAELVPCSTKEGCDAASEAAQNSDASEQRTRRKRRLHERCITCSIPSCKAFLARLRREDESSTTVDRYVERGGVIYCMMHYQRIFHSKATCLGCNEPFRRDSDIREWAFQTPTASNISGSPKFYHLSCFTCCICNEILTQGAEARYRKQDGRVICSRHPILSSSSTSLAKEDKVTTDNREQAEGDESGRGSYQGSICGSGDEDQADMQGGHRQTMPPGRGEASTPGKDSKPKQKSPQSSTEHNSESEEAGSTSGASGAEKGGRRGRTVFTAEQTSYLTLRFQQDQNPDSQDLQAMGKEAGLPKRTIQIWFQNQRARNKKTRVDTYRGPGLPVTSPGFVDTPTSYSQGQQGLATPFSPTCTHQAATVATHALSHHLSWPSTHGPRLGMAQQEQYRTWSMDTAAATQPVFATEASFTPTYTLPSLASPQVAAHPASLHHMHGSASASSVMISPPDEMRGLLLSDVPRFPHPPS